MGGKTLSLLGWLAVLTVSAVLAWLFFSLAPQIVQAPKSALQKNLATTTPEGTGTGESWNPVRSATEAVAGLFTPAKSYANDAFHYSFSYPGSWTLDPEIAVEDDVHHMPSIVSAHEEKDSPRRFSVTINRDERDLKEFAPVTEAVTVGGKTATAYIFPDGYDCTDDPDCSFFLIPVFHNGVWYEIVAANDAKTLDAYRTILASFSFTQ